jgi:type I restriction enzyme S subunit
MSDLIPNGWTKSKYESILEEGLVNGLYKHANFYGNGTAKILDLGYLFNKEKRSLSGCSPIELTDSELRKYKVNVGDILFNRVSIKPEGIGQCVHVDEHDFDLVFESNIIRSRVNKRLSDSLFISYLLSSDLLRKDIFTRAKITAQASIGQSDLLSLHFLLPPLPEQQKISTILSSVDEVIEKTQAQIHKLKDLKKGMMQELLSPREGQATNKNRALVSKENGIHHSEFKDSALGRIPAGWDVVPMSDHIIENRSGASLKPSDFSNEGFEVIPKKSVQFGGKLITSKKTFCSIEYAESTPRSRVDNTFMITVLRDLVPTGPSIGLIVEIDRDDVFLMAQGVYGFKLDGGLHSGYLAQLSNTDWYRGEMRKIFVGSTQIHIRSSEFFEVLIPKPPIIEQIKIHKVLSAVDSKIALLSNKMGTIQATKKALMQDLLTGKVRVKVDAA